MNFVRHAENRPGQDPQIFSSRSNHYFSNAGGCLGKIQCRRAGGKNLNGSNRRTVFSMANETTTNYLPPHPKPDNNQKPLTRCPFFRSKPKQWLFDEAISYQAAWRRATEQWQFTGSVSSIRRFFERTARERMLADLAEVRTEVKSIAKTKVQTADLKNAALKIVARLFLKQVTEAPANVRDWTAIGKLLLRHEANENHARLQGERNAIRVAAFELDRERFRKDAVASALDHLPALQELAEAQADASLTQYEQNIRTNALRRSMFGENIPDPAPESAEEEAEQKRKYEEWRQAVAPQPL